MDTGFSKNVASPAEMDWLPPGTHMVWVWVWKSSSTMGLISQKRAALKHENWHFTINGRWYLDVYGIYILHIHIYLHIYIYYIIYIIYICVIYIHIHTNEKPPKSFQLWTMWIRLRWWPMWHGFPFWTLTCNPNKKMQRRRYHQRPWLIIFNNLKIRN